MSYIGCHNRHESEKHEPKDNEPAKQQRSHNDSGYTLAALPFPSENVELRYQAPGRMKSEGHRNW
jgi:hypothetical protein